MLQRLLSVFTLFTLIAVQPVIQAQDTEPRKPGPHPESQKLKNPFPLDEKTAMQGQRIFARLCITCHGKDGKGETDMVDMLDVKPSDLTKGEYKYGKTDGEMFTLLRDGTMTGMVPFGNQLKEPQLWHLVNYVRTFAPKTAKGVVVEETPVPENPIEYTKASIQRGKQFYARFCIKCHGANGKGDTEMREFLATHPSDLTNGEWKYGSRDGDLFTIIKNGNQGDMDAFAAMLNDERIWHVVNYLKSMNPKTD
jgi:cytochrome c oxidase cbb3-type subunit 3